ncbi:MAG TPA: hypothetical protein VM870_03945, partial [Pyrinomonadaceae bacterium]|nr:hypothetical protein [Pyrinomonadaceae bacterium]
MRNQNLTRDFIGRILALTLLAGVLTGALPARAQRRSGATRPAQAARKSAASTEPPRRPTETSLAWPSTSVLAQAWQTGELPAPLTVPAGDTDEVAAALAQKVAAKNQESVPALLTALQLAGFFITGRNGQVLHRPPDGRGQGLTINGWEVASVARMYGDHRSLSLDEFERQLRSVPVLRGFAPPGQSGGAVLVEGIRRNADNTRNPYLRI